MLTLLHGDALTKLAEIESESVQTCVTSPPYWGLRDYGVAPIVWGNHNGCVHEWEQHLQPSANGQTTHAMIAETLNESSATRKPKLSDFCKCGAWRGAFGLEPTPELYVDHLTEIMRDVRRVLRKDGTLWLNLGDSYAGGGNYRGTNEETLSAKQRSNRGAHGMDAIGRNEFPPTCRKAGLIGLKPKDLVGIPWMVAFALRADGWYLRSDIIWSKPNPMPESVTDRPTKSHEYIFLLTKSRKYFYDAAAIKESIADSSVQRINQPNFDNQTGGEKDYSNGTNPNRSARKALENFAKGNGGAYSFARKTATEGKPGVPPQHRTERESIDYKGVRNKRSVWEIPTALFPEAHFATFPKDLVIPCVLAGSTAGDTVLDPFAGSGTTGKVAIELGRKAILIEPKDEYVEMIERRCKTTIGLPLMA